MITRAYCRHIALPRMLSRMRLTFINDTNLIYSPRFTAVNNMAGMTKIDIVTIFFVMIDTHVNGRGFRRLHHQYFFFT